MLLHKLRRRLRAVLRRRQVERDLDDEIRLHLEMETQKLRRQGLSDREARRQASLAFGAVERFREEARDARGVRPLEDLQRDLRLGLRALARRPAFTVVILATLALGVGGSAAMFGAVHGILLTPLPYAGAERLVAVWERHERGGDRIEAAPANFLDWRERASTLELVSAEPYGFDWRRPEGPVYLPAWLVSEGFFEAMRVAPLLGRTFGPDEHVAGRAAVAVLGYDLWRSRFAADPEIVGETLDFEGSPFEVIGVMPEGFALPNLSPRARQSASNTMWAPKVWQGWEERARTSNFYRVYGRLQDAVALAQAQVEMDGIAERLAEEHPRSNGEAGITLVRLPEEIVGGVRGALLLLLGAVALVLVLVSANVASLQLTRAIGRGRELALRGALGAGSLRVARELLAENLLVGVAGGGLGFLLAQLALKVMRSLAPSSLPRVHEMQADLTVFSFALALSLAAVLVTGLLPTVMVARRRLSTSLLEGGRSVTGGRWLRRLQGGLVVLQVSLSLMLLIGAGLLIRSFFSLQSVDRGFRTEGIVAGAAQAWLDDPADTVAFTRRVISALEAHFAVSAAGMTTSLPFMEEIGPNQGDLTFPDRPLGPDESVPRVRFNAATPDYFTTLEIPILRGRGFDSRDRADSLPVVLVNESFARHYWSGEEPLGRRLALSAAGPPTEREVVGVVGDVRREALHLEPRPEIYIPRAQTAIGANVFVVRGVQGGDAAEEQLLEVLRQAVFEINPLLPVSPSATLSELVGESVEDRRFLMALLSSFAGLALALAAAGIFGLMSFAIAERTREIGVRIALGSGRVAIIRMLLRFGGSLAGTGILFGALAAVAITRVLTGMLYRVTPLDPITYLLGAVVLLLTALLACFVPAWRAGRTDPVRVLQAD